MDNSVLTEVGKQIPALTILVFLVVWFLKYLQAMMQSHKEEIKRIHDSHGQQLKEIITANQRVISENRSLYERTLTVLGKHE